MGTSWAHRPALFTLAASIDRENVSILYSLWLLLLHQLLILSVLLLLLFPVHLVALFRVIIYFISLLLSFTVCRENLVTTARKGHQWWWCFALCNRRPFIFFFVVEASVTPCFDPVCPVELSNYVLSRQCDTEHPEFQSVSQSG